MSITSDLRKQLDDVTGTAGEYVGKYTATARDNVQSVADKATGAVNDLRASAEKAINLDTIKSAVEPYLAQVKEYGTAVTDRAEALLTELKKKDPRVAKLIEAAESTAETVVVTVQQRVVAPLTGRGAAKPARKPAASTARPAAAKAKRPAATKPASRPATKSTTARKAPAKTTPKA